MLPSMWTSFLVEMSPEDATRRLGEHSWPAAELSTEHSQMLLDRGHPESTGAAYAELAGDCGVAVGQGHLKLQANIIGEEWQATICELRTWLDLYLAIGIRRAVLHPGRMPGASAEEVLQARCRSLSQLADHLTGSDLVICLENMADSTAGELLDIVSAAGSSHLAVCLDTGHLHLAGGNQGDFIRQCGDTLQALHIADNDGSGDQHLTPFGRGRVDWADVMDGLREIGYSGTLNFEIPGERRCPLPVQLAKLGHVLRIGHMMIDGSAFR